MPQYRLPVLTDVGPAVQHAYIQRRRAIEALEARAPPVLRLWS